MISAVILTKNEEKNIEACLRSVSWCDEIIVIDDNSTDKTVELVKKSGAIVFVHPVNGDFSAQRNYGISKAKTDWIFFLDADERVSSALWYEIMAQTNEAIGPYVGFYVKRQDTMWGKVLKYGETGNIRILRIAKRNAGKWEGRVHETWKVSGNVTLLRNHLDHYPHETVESFLKEINFYTDLRAKELFDKKAKAYLWSIILYPLGKFTINYFFKRGFMDGTPGFVLAMHMALHSFLVRSKLWLNWHKNND